MSAVWCRSRRVEGLYLLTLVVVALAAFQGSVDLGWAYDDLDYLDNARKAAQTPAYVFSVDKPWAARPVVHAYFALLYPFLGDDARGYHVFNVALHVFNSFLCCLILRRFGVDQVAAALAGGLFLLNVSHFRAIYWVSGVSLLLGTLFGLLATTAALRTKTGEGSRWLPVCMFLMATLAHEGMAVFAVPVVWVAWAGRGVRRFVLESMPYVGVVAVILVLSTVIYPTALNQESGYGVGWHMLHNEAAFITRLFLGAHWDIWLPGAPPGLEVAGGLVVIAALCATTLRHRALLPAVLWLVAAPLPYVLWPHGTAVSRYYYAPSTAIAAITALALWRLTRVSRNAGIVLVALLCCASLFSLHRVLAIQYAYSGAFHFNTRHDPGQALLQYQRSVDIHVYPENAAAILGNRAKALLLTGRAPEASKAFLDLLSRYPNRRDFYAPALRASVASGDLGIAADPSGSQEVTEQMLVAAEQQLRVLRDAAAAAGDTARVAGLDRLRRYYFAR